MVMRHVYGEGRVFMGTMARVNPLLLKLEVHHARIMVSAYRVVVNRLLLETAAEHASRAYYRGKKKPWRRKGRRCRRFFFL